MLEVVSHIFITSSRDTHASGNRLATHVLTAGWNWRDGPSSSLQWQYQEVKTGQRHRSGVLQPTINEVYSDQGFNEHFAFPSTFSQLYIGGQLQRDIYDVGKCVQKRLHV